MVFTTEREWQLLTNTGLSSHPPDATHGQLGTQHTSIGVIQYQDGRIEEMKPEAKKARAR